MTAEEIKTALNKKCEASWILLKAIEKTFGKNSLQAEKAITKWITYDDLFRELYNESPIYNF